jgi:hypothetical protein
LKFSGAGTFADTAATARNREGASSASRNAIKPPRELPAANATRVDADFADKLVGHPRQETNVVDVEPVRADVTDNVAYVPVTLIRIGIGSD